MNTDAAVEWVDARERLPSDGCPVAAATAGRYPPDDEAPSGQDFWLVLSMYFTSRHRAKDGTEYRDCFVDSDGVVRLPHGRPGDESVTHWAYLPKLPGVTARRVLGEEARAALRNALR